MQNPTVSFVVPCYKLAHFLPECVNSILSQSFSDFEILIMDDCSPDNTSEVAALIQDTRVRYMRNESNLGHLKNYNKGIQMACGKYVWLISADDRLRRRYVLERYVQVMEDNPRVGYVFCSGIGLKDGMETSLLRYYYYGSVDYIFNGRQFISTVLFNDSGMLSPSVMVRKDCYEQISMFPLDMPHKGDMYLWFIWALHYDVAYLSESMVNYRSHDLNMMTDLMTRVPLTVFKDDVNVLWRIKRKADEIELKGLAQHIEFRLAKTYADMAASATDKGIQLSWKLDVEHCNDALRNEAANVHEYLRLRGKFYSLLAERNLQQGAFKIAKLSMKRAGEYADAKNAVMEFLQSFNLKQVEPRRLAQFRLSAARLYWCQGKFLMGILTASHAVITWPIILGFPLKPLLRWVRLVDAKYRRWPCKMSH